LLSLAGGFLSSAVVSVIAVGFWRTALRHRFFLSGEQSRRYRGHHYSVATPAVITHFVSGKRKSDAALREQADLLNLSSVEE
jgi:hypothetical protein